MSEVCGRGVFTRRCCHRRLGDAGTGAALARFGVFLDELSILRWTIPLGLVSGKISFLSASVFVVPIGCSAACSVDATVYIRLHHTYVRRIADVRLYWSSLRRRTRTQIQIPIWGHGHARSSWWSECLITNSAANEDRGVFAVGLCCWKIDLLRILLLLLEQLLPLTVA